MHFRLSAANGDLIEEGEGQVEVDDRTVTLSPQLGQPLRIRPEQITDISEPAPFMVRLRLTDGTSVDLSQLGVIRTQLLSQIGEVRSKEAHWGLVTIGMGEAQRFHGAVNDIEADISLYDDGVVAIPLSGLPVQAPYAVIENVGTDASGYRITIDLGDAGSVVVQRLAQTTSQFLALLRKRVTDARGRTGAFLGTLLPGLGPMAQRQIAGELRDGVAVPRASLDAVQATVWPTLLEAAALPDRLQCAHVIETLGETSLGFHQRDSVEVAAQGTIEHSEAQPVQSSGPGMGQSTGMPMLQRGLGMVMAESALGVPPPGTTGGPAFEGPAGGVAGMPGMGMGFGAPYGLFGGMLAMRMLRGDNAWAGMQSQPARQMLRVPDKPTEPGSLTPAHTDFDALTSGGDAPTILGFLVARTPDGHIIYETLNESDHATYVFFDPAMTVRLFNLSLLLIGFHIEVLAGDITGAGARYGEAIKRLPYLAALAAAFRGRAIHLEDWEAQLRRLIT